MRGLRILCVCVALTAPIAAVVAACSDPLNDIGGPGKTTEDAATLVGDEDAPVVVTPPVDTGSPFIDVGIPDTFVPLNPYDASDRPDGGLQVTPGVITCGGGTCNAFAGNQCCTGDDGGACLSTSVQCGAGGSMTCDEAADCLIGKACCGALSTADGGPYLSSTCATSCATPSGIQMCRTNGECGDAGPCVVQTCSDGLTYEMCGVVAPGGGGTGDGGFTCTPN